MIYKRLSDLLEDEDELMVCALYTRRGGIDICPIRYSKNCHFNDIEKLMDLSIFARCGIKQ
jgi:7-cyano-7-deazaguanine reductase